MKRIVAIVFGLSLAVIYVRPLPAQTLTLDYSTYLGGIGNDYGEGIIVGSGGEAYVAGSTFSENFPTENPYQAGYAGSADVFVSKFGSSGSKLIFSTYLGGSDDDYGYGITLGTGGEAYVIGNTQSSNFPTKNPYQAGYAGSQDVLVSKLSSSGSELSYSTYLGGSDDEYGYGITLGTGGEAYVIGNTQSSNFPTKNPYQERLGGNTNAFVSKLSSSGSELSYSTYLGGSADDYGGGIILGTGDEAFITGYTYSANFPTKNPYQAGYAGSQDAFVSKLDSSGSGLSYSTYLGGSNTDYGGGITVGSDSESYVIGHTSSSNFPTKNPYQARHAGSADVFVSKLSSSGSELSYSTYLGGSKTDYGWGITLETDGEAYVTGTTESSNFPTENPYQAGNSGGYDAFVSKLGSSGSILSFSTYLGGSDEDGGSGIVVGDIDGSYVIGNTGSVNFPTKNPYQAEYGGGYYDVFVSRLKMVTPSLTPSPTPSSTPTATPSVTPSPSVTLTPSAAPTPSVAPSPSVIPTPSPMPTPSLYPTPPYLVLSSGDYSGDGLSDIAIFRPASGLWAVRKLGRIYYGQAGDVPVSGDYDGDGITDVSVFREASGLWAVKDLTRLYFGDEDCLPVPGDFDGDGSCDVAIFNGEDGTWRVRGLTRLYFGASGDLPVPGDYDNDGSSDIAIFRPATGLWAVRGISRVYYGAVGDRPVPGIYRWYGGEEYGSGPFRSQIGIYRPTTGLWAIRSWTRYYFGMSSDTPLTGDFSGNALDDTGVFRPTTGLWAVRGVTRVYYGANGDIPATR